MSRHYFDLLEGNLKENKENHMLIRVIIFTIHWSKKKIIIKISETKLDMQQA
jgi:hypothetical protein